jgi:hypothetical protein
MRCSNLVPGLLAFALAIPGVVHAAEGDAAAAAKTQSDAAFAELDKLLAAADGKDATAEIAMAGRAAADNAAMADSAKAGGAGLATPPPPAKAAEAAKAPPVVEAKPDVKPTAGLLTAQAQDPSERADELLGAMGLSDGEQQLPDGQFGFVAMSTPVVVQFAPGTKGYVAAREMAFQIADLQARGKITKFLDEQVETERDFSKAREDRDKTSIPSPDAAGAAKAKSVAEQELDAELKKAGVDPSAYEGAPPEKKRMILGQAFAQSIRSKSGALLAGAATLFVTEGPVDGKHCIVVGLIWTERLSKLASLAMSPKIAARPIAPESKKAAMARLPLGNALQLVRNFGAQMVSDGRGNQWIVANGQTNYTDADDLDIAYEEAEQNALAALTLFVNERVDRATQTEKRQVMEKFNDGSMNAEQVKATMTAMSGKAKLKISGHGAVKKWKTTIDGSKVCGVVLMWSPQSAANALGMRQQMQQAATPGATPPAGGGTTGGASGAGHSTSGEY